MDMGIGPEDSDNSAVTDAIAATGGYDSESEGWQAAVDDATKNGDD